MAQKVEWVLTVTVYAESSCSVLDKSAVCRYVCAPRHVFVVDSASLLEGPSMGKSIAMRVSVCLPTRISHKPQSKLHIVFCTCYTGPWLDHPLTMEYVV